MIVREERITQNARIKELLYRFDDVAENPMYLKWVIELLFERIKELEERIE